MKEKLRSMKIVEAWQIEAEYQFGGFELKFRGQTEFGAPAQVKIVLHFCDMTELARQMWKMLRKRQEKINEVSEVLSGSKL